MTIGAADVTTIDITEDGMMTIGAADAMTIPVDREDREDRIDEADVMLTDKASVMRRTDILDDTTTIDHLDAQDVLK